VTNEEEEPGSHDTPLEALAAYVGIVPGYTDQTGRDHRTSDDTRRALLAALGLDASTDDAAHRSLAALRAEERRRLIPPVRVVDVDDPSARRVSVRAPLSSEKCGSCRLELELEDGRCHVIEEGWPDGDGLEFHLTTLLPLGYHRLRVTVALGDRELTDEQTLIVVPARCVLPDELLGPDRAFGLTANLYTVRSSSNWGVGDFSDLAALAEWGGSVGADFVGVNPLHALLNRGDDISPYSPVSRLFRNPLYIDIARVPELAFAETVRDRLAAPEFRAQLESLREASDVRYEQVMAVKGLALDALHRAFQEQVAGSGSARDRAYADFVAHREPALTHFATWMTIAEQHGYGPDWRRWPSDLRSPDSHVTRRFAEAHAARIDFHRWVQFEADSQLEHAATSARAAGMRIGLYQDLAIGTCAASSDSWAFPELFLRGVSVGAPPDPLAEMGQNWGLPPINPQVLKRDGYRYFVELLRSGFRHAGALRIDHVLGLFRLFWIPDGKSGAEGAYVRYPTDDLLGIVALESVRHRALVVGEDLGTVPHGVPATLEKWGVLSSKVLYFEREHDGRFKAAHHYPSLALATANTHDLPTIAGFWHGHDIDLRRDLGLIDGEHAVAQAHRERDNDRSALLQRLEQEAVLPGDGSYQSPVELRAAIHAFLCRTPAKLVGLSLDDLSGEVQPVNVPGVRADRYSSWTRKMRHRLETITTSDDVRAVLRCDGRMRGAPLS
jgi:4-alpha-glucanotransferase